MCSSPPTPSSVVLVFLSSSATKILRGGKSDTCVLQLILSCRWEQPSGSVLRLSLSHLTSTTFFLGRICMIFDTPFFHSSAIYIIPPLVAFSEG